MPQLDLKYESRDTRVRAAAVLSLSAASFRAGPTPMSEYLTTEEAAEYSGEWCPFVRELAGRAWKVADETLRGSDEDTYLLAEALVLEGL